MSYVNKLRIMSISTPDTTGGGFAGAMTVLKDALLSALTGQIFELQLNPENYSRKFSIKYKCPDEQGANSNAAQTQFDGIKPEELDLKFTIDGTGVVPFQLGADVLNPLGNLSAQFDASGANLMYVTTKLDQLQTVVYHVMDETHRTPILLISWGKLVFMGIMEDMTTNFTLFHSSGLPLRVEVSMKFKQFKLPAPAAAALSLLSPDLTRRRTVKASDTILTICEDVYESPYYYLEVAKANNITNFRKISAGTELILPPIEN